MSDYIEREAALDVVNGWLDQLIPIYGKNDEYVKCLETVAEHLESLHAADVRPVRFGKLEKYGAAIRCSVCGFDTQSWDVNFCPNCGADMKGEADGN